MHLVRHVFKWDGCMYVPGCVSTVLLHVKTSASSVYLIHVSLTYVCICTWLPAPSFLLRCSVTEACPPTPSNAYTTSQAYVLFYHKKAWHTHTRACVQMHGTKRALIYIVHMCMFPIVFLYSLHNDMLAPKPTKSGTFSMTCMYLYYVYYIYTLVCVCVYLYTHMYV